MFNGCQGSMPARSVLDLRMDPFVHDQLYTALSRVRTRRDIMYLFAEADKGQGCANIVFPDLLL
ncbi:helicase [Suillus subaureus]|uniref:Helicase n=1 Tax=Suillus subaureus TaxID=48587 RepID=A0A9P7E8X6_9AGAM|nr:helicase [Suillus subaureus]KAG1814661.1 helicase [Suillus subaureus]